MKVPSHTLGISSIRAMQTISVKYMTTLTHDDDPELTGTWTFFLDTITVMIEWLDAKGKDWTEFLAALRSSGTASVTFCISNGEVSVGCHGDRVIFCTSKDGAGGNGSIEVTVKVTDELIECFERAARELQ